MAVHSFFGFGGAMAGPVVAGVVLDFAGGRNDAIAWGFTYASIAAIAILTPIVFRMSR
jgi:MFS family permease